jgi:hypothetical protein
MYSFIDVMIVCLNYVRSVSLNGAAFNPSWHLTAVGACQFRCRGSRRESAVAQLFSLWSPQIVASSFRHFIQILERLQVLARGRATPVQMEKHPLTDSERAAFIDSIRRDSADADVSFWELICETDA